MWLKVQEGFTCADLIWFYGSMALWTRLIDLKRTEGQTISMETKLSKTTGTENEQNCPLHCPVGSLIIPLPMTL